MQVQLKDSTRLWFDLVTPMVGATKIYLMTYAVSVVREVAASPEKVWALVTDLPRMGEWSPENQGGKGRKVRLARQSVQHLKVETKMARGLGVQMS